MTYVTVSFSGGKDSTAMLLRMMELGEHIDEVITCDTGMEFPEMYDHLDKVRKIVEANGIRYTVLKADHSFEWFMIDKPISSPKWGTYYGYGWPGPHMRWCTKHLKTEVVDKYVKGLRARHGVVVQCIGLAADEERRLERANNRRANHRHPLVEWGWTEADALRYCYDRGFDWGGLYEHFNRVSCWCCPLASVHDMRALWRHHPDLWARLLELDARMYEDGAPHCRNPYTVRATIGDLTRRFEREDLAEKEQTTLADYIPVLRT